MPDYARAMLCYHNQSRRPVLKRACRKALVEEEQMQQSARNQMRGTVQQIKKDEIMAEVTIKIADGAELVSVITATSAERLGLMVGKEVTVIIKSTDVMIGGE
jgi:molybdate transport system regulatory protein